MNKVNRNEIWTCTCGFSTYYERVMIKHRYKHENPLFVYNSTEDKK